MALVITSLGGGHTDTHRHTDIQTHRHTDTQTHTHIHTLRGQDQFLETRHGTPGLIREEQGTVLCINVYSH